jgi:dihydrofolate synthase/folylpolyglutamate synthase
VAINFLHSLINYERCTSAFYDFKLRKFKRFLKELGAPQKSLRRIVIIAGTKGKGSSATLIAEALKAAGFNVGLYTSPHLIDFRERIKFNGKKISLKTVKRMLEEIKPLVIKHRLSYFETLTALAFLYFLEKKVDFTVLEVGLGGRLDATNVVSPMVSVITRIGYDHQEILGKTLEKITKEKAGIIRPWSFVVSAPQRPIVQKTLIKYIKENKVPLDQFYYVPEHLEIKNFNTSLQGSSLVLIDKDSQERYFIKLKSIGIHQAENLLVAYGVLKYFFKGGVITKKEFVKGIYKGFSRAFIPGRIEVIKKKPIIILDVAHNPDSAESLMNVLGRIVKRKVIMVFGASYGKLIKRMIKIYKPLLKLLILTEAPQNPRALITEELAKIIRPLGVRWMEFKDYREASDYALKLSTQENYRPLVITGSFYLCGAILKYLSRKKSSSGLKIGIKMSCSS